MTETEAPDGYVLSTHVDYWLIEVRVDETDATKHTIVFYTVDETTDGPVRTETADFVIVNIEQYILPITGGWGTAYYTILGLLLIVGGALTCIQTMKKRMEL